MCAYSIIQRMCQKKLGINIMFFFFLFFFSKTKLCCQERLNKIHQRGLKYLIINLGLSLLIFFIYILKLHMIILHIMYKIKNLFS